MPIVVCLLTAFAAFGLGVLGVVVCQALFPAPTLSQRRTMRRKAARRK